MFLSALYFRPIRRCCPVGSPFYGKRLAWPSSRERSGRCPFTPAELFTVRFAPVRGIPQSRCLNGFRLETALLFTAAMTDNAATRGA